ncbi:MAG: heavy-metal-associated domain-containing protein [Fimbriimonadaceae bacterium]|nr:heavy-metal-associated domain-containing protein [Fimbriimonadaceae bacterium]QYK56980.1 MAG: heavy-metal-associated domain-containing protein [Fimbriimonadaceae bacterium]
MQRFILQIKGMTCAHCAKAVESALIRARGVDSAKVDWESHFAEITGEDIDLTSLAGLIEQEGYTLAGIDSCV